MLAAILSILPVVIMHLQNQHFREVLENRRNLQRTYCSYSTGWYVQALVGRARLYTGKCQYKTANIMLLNTSTAIVPTQRIILSSINRIREVPLPITLLPYANPCLLRRVSVESPQSLTTCSRTPQVACQTQLS